MVISAMTSASGGMFPSSWVKRLARSCSSSAAVRPSRIALRSVDHRTRGRSGRSSAIAPSGTGLTGGRGVKPGTSPIGVPR